MGWLDQGVGHSFIDDPWEWATRFLCKERGWATHIFYTDYFHCISTCADNNFQCKMCISCFKHEIT